jgi:hypothetical protein
VDAFLNLTGFNPYMTMGVCQMLERLGRRAERHVLEAWLAPRTVFASGEPPEQWGLPQAIDVVVDLGVVRDDNGVLTLEESISTSATQFPHLLRRRILTRAREGAVDDPVKALADGLAALMHYSHWPLMVTWEAMQQHQADLNVEVVINNVRWGLLERWAVFLGFGWRVDDRLVADPTAALVAAVDDILPPGGELNIASFCESIGDELVVVDYGPAFEDLRPSGSDTSRLSAPLSLALLRLERRGVLAFPAAVGDAPNQRTIRSSVDRRHSHVRRPRVAGAAG